VAEHSEGVRPSERGLFHWCLPVMSLLGLFGVAGCGGTVGSGGC